MALPSKELSESALDSLITRERTRIVAPLTEWRTLALQLRDEGLVRGPGEKAAHDSGSYQRDTVVPRRRRERGGWWSTTTRWSMRVAASAALLGGGIVLGRGMTIGNDLAQTISTAILADSMASHGGMSVAVGGEPLKTPEDAQKLLVQAQTEYQRAAAFLAASDTASHVPLSPDIYRDRLAALDEMTEASMNALRESPSDPLLNQYYLSAAAAREATLQQLGQALPAGTRMVRF